MPNDFGQQHKFKVHAMNNHPPSLQDNINNARDPKSRFFIDEVQCDMSTEIRNKMGLQECQRPRVTTAALDEMTAYPLGSIITLLPPTTAELSLRANKISSPGLPNASIVKVSRRL